MLEHSNLSVNLSVQEVSAQINTPGSLNDVPGLLADDLSNDDSWAKPKKRTNRRLTYFTGLLALTLFGLGTFVAGAKMSKSSATSTGSNARRAGAFSGLGGTTGGFPGGFGGAGGFPGGAGGRTGSGTTGSASGATAAGSAALNDLLNGTSSASTASTGPAIQGRVTAVDGTSVTVTKADGTTGVITLDGKATFARRTNTTVGDIKIGDALAAEGTTDTAGNVAASAVTVGDLPLTADASSAEPTPATGSDLGGLLGG